MGSIVFRSLQDNSRANESSSPFGIGLQAHSVVSRMMVEEQLAGSWDQPTRTVVMHNAQPGRLQTLASELSDRAAALVDLNERALQLRTGGPREEDEGGGNYGEPGTRVYDLRRALAKTLYDLCHVQSACALLRVCRECSCRQPTTADAARLRQVLKARSRR